MSKETSATPIAVIGIACWYPDARNPRQLWENILSRRRQFRQIPDQRLPLKHYYHSDPNEPDKTYAKQVAVIDGFNFDWAGRRVPYVTFRTTDVAHWLALEVAFEAISDAGYSRENIPSERAGVIVGNSLTGEESRASIMRLRWPYVKRALKAAAKSKGISNEQTARIESALQVCYKSVFPSVNEDTLAGGLSNTIAGRICKFLNLHGGGYTVDGACSSSLLAIATAANGLMKGDFDVVVAGGVDISLDPFELVGFAKTGALTKKDMTVYDRGGSGFLPGEGCGFVMLKRLDDAIKDKNYIYAALRGWGISSDGGGTGLTAPSAKGQSRALKRAYEAAPYGVENLHFIEGHGTGTVVGDRVELEAIALTAQDSSYKKGRFCGMTSLKSIIGHTKAASGIGGFIKAVMAVNRRILPPIAACKEPHPVFDTKANFLYPIIQGEIRKPDEILRGGVSAMGFGGINCHATVESYDSPSSRLEPSIKERSLMVSNQETEIFVLTADSAQELEKKVDDLVQISKGISIAELADIASKLGQEAHKMAVVRSAVIADKPDELAELLKLLLSMIKEKFPTKGEMLHDATRKIWLSNDVNKQRIGMLFPGQGSQKLNMAQVLVKRFDWAEDIVRKTDQWLQDSGAEPISELIYHRINKTESRQEIESWFNALSKTEYAQPSICLSSYLWLTFLQKLGIKPSVVGGHSLGELTAFYAAGAFDLQKLIHLASVRGRAMMASSDRSGAMVSLRCSKEEGEAFLKQVDGYVVLANINSPSQVVLSGEEYAVENVIKAAAERGVLARRLKVSNAFHSKLASNAVNALENADFIPEKLHDIEVRLFSNDNGKEIKQDVFIRKHFAKHAMSQVDFVAMIKSMASECDIFIEVGPGRVLTNLANDITNNNPVCFPVESIPFKDRDINTLLAALFMNGIDIDWHELYKERLIRPFIAPSKRLFIENPCERPFDISEIDNVSHPVESNILDSTLQNLVGLPSDKLLAYLENRGQFLSELILADMKYSVPTHTPVTPTKFGVQTERLDDELGSINNKPSKLSSKSEPSKDMKTILFSAIEKITGFPKDSLNVDMRLLDDLNLDSIKVADLIVKVRKEAGLKEESKPLSNANATLSEVLKQFTKHDGENVSVAETKNILQIVMEQTAQITGYPEKALDPDVLVEHDLNIGQDLLRQILQKSTSLLNIKTQFDLEPLLKRSLRQIANVLERIVISDEKKQAAIVDLETDPWVREFKIDLIDEPFPVLPEWWGKRKEDDWQTINTLIINAFDSIEVAESLHDSLLRKGANVRIATFGEAQNKLIEDPAYSHIIAILPQTTGEYNSHNKFLQNIVERIATVALIPPASLAPRRRTTVAYIQFGGGYFGKSPVFSYLNQCCALAFASSLHLERDDLRVRVLDFSPAIDMKIIAEKAIDEINTPAPFVAVGFDFELRRKVPVPKLIQPATYSSRSIKWSSEDVILVTGGAKGITASCAFALAQTIGVRMALIGSSVYSDANGNQEITKTLQKYKNNGLVAKYFACDISNHDAVISTILKIQQEMGQITGVIHGAGLNIPRRAKQASVEDAMQEISPKVIGALNLASALKDNSLKIFVGFCSVIGVTGMQGNAWYGFSNEALDIILHRFEAEHPETKTLSISYSVWSDEGMGAKLGIVKNLQKMGIESIPTKEGIIRFVRLVLNNPNAHQVVVTARLGDLDTWKFNSIPIPENARYLEKPLYCTPEVESAFSAHLTLERDPYLKDHLFNGSYLLPTVFGIEAMAQAIAHITGKRDFSRVRIEDIKLKRPITVDTQTGADIVVWTEIQEDEIDSSIQVIRAGVYKSGATNKLDFFSAVFMLGIDDEPPKQILSIPDKPLNIIPKLDLYHERLFFQGKRFQRIDKVWEITEAKESAESAIFETKLYNSVKVSQDAFPDPLHQTIFLKDPFFRDTLLQSAYLLVPQETCLPVSIKCLDIYPSDVGKNTSIKGIVKLNNIDAKEINCSVAAVDFEGRIIEKLEGYALKTLGHHNDYPSSAELIASDERDNKIANYAAKKFGDSLSVEIPKMLLKYISGMHNLSKDERHSLELPMLSDVISQTMKINKSPYEIKWLESGKPIIDGQNKVGISVSHDERICLCVADNTETGCDVAPINKRTRQQWRELLGQLHDHLLDELLNKSDSLDCSGTKIWSAMEVLQKTIGESNNLLKIISYENNAVLFKSKFDDQEILILTFPILLTKGPERIFAFRVHKKRASEFLSIDYNFAYKSIFEMRDFEIVENGHQGQVVFVHRFPVTFRANAQLSRTIYFSNYFFWMGKVREASIWPILGKVGEQCASGKWGLVTNRSHLQICGEACAQDMIEIRLWVSKNHGPANSTMDLNFDFRKIIANGKYERLAWCKHQVTWVQILGHGIVKPEAYPDYYQDFIKNFLPRYDAPNTFETLAEPLAEIVKQANQDKEKYTAPAGPIIQPLLYEQIIETSLEDSNLVGNIYFANYYAWQGRTRDHYFFNLIPKYYQSAEKQGELLCVETKVNHLREAMPFDKIIVTMALKTLKKCSLTLYFEYFLMHSDGSRTKLAFGEQTAVWATRKAKEKPVLAPFPSKVWDALQGTISK